MPITGKKISELDQNSIDAFNELKFTVSPFTKIVWFGTSVPNSGSANSYVYQLDALLNVTIYKKYYGGHVVKKGPNGDTQYGFSSDSTLDEITEAGLPYTFRYILDNGGSSLWDANLYVFDHGHNDAGLMDAYKVGGVLTLTAENAFDRDWMVGGLNHIIAEILKVNTYARFAIVNEYRYEAFDNKVANQLVADYWGIPILNWELGVRNFNPNSALEANVLKYYTGTELPGGADFIHPGPHLTSIMAKKLAWWIKSIV